MIPEAAVEAAWQSFREFRSVRSPGNGKDGMRAALAAAAPHMLAGVWDEGERTGRSRAMRHMSDEPNLPLVASNPYGSAK